MTNKINNHISGGKAVVECLKAHNVKFVFGLIGSATMELFDSLYDEKDMENGEIPERFQGEIRIRGRANVTFTQI